MNEAESINPGQKDKEEQQTAEVRAEQFPQPSYMDALYCSPRQNYSANMHWRHPDVNLCIHLYEIRD